MQGFHPECHRRRQESRFQALLVAIVTLKFFPVKSEQVNKKQPPTQSQRQWQVRASVQHADWAWTKACLCYTALPIQPLNNLLVGHTGGHSWIVMRKGKLVCFHGEKIHTHPSSTIPNKILPSFIIQHLICSNSVSLSRRNAEPYPQVFHSHMQTHMLFRYSVSSIYKT